MRAPARLEWKRGDLGAKLDECTACGLVGRHELVRDIRWLRLGPIPLVPVGLRHGLVCASCGALTPMRWTAVRSAARRGSMPLPDRPRPASVAGGGAGPDLDRVTRRAGLDAATWQFAVWAVVVLIVVGLGVQKLPMTLNPNLKPPSIAGADCLSEVGATAGTPLPTAVADFQLTATPCSEPHNFEVLVETTVPFDDRATWPPEADFGAEVRATCEAAYQKVFGHPSQGAPVEVVIFGPDPVDWLKGDRAAQCTVYDPAHPWMKGSFKTGTALPWA